MHACAHMWVCLCGYVIAINSHLVANFPCFTVCYIHGNLSSIHSTLLTIPHD